MKHKFLSIFLSIAVFIILSSCTGISTEKENKQASVVSAKRNGSSEIFSQTETSETEIFANISGGAESEVSSALQNNVSSQLKASQEPTHSASSQPIAVAKINLNKSAVTLEIGSTVALTVAFLPNDVENKTVTWSSSKPEIAAVIDGTITAKAAGTAIITAKSISGQSTSCTVTVNSPVKKSIYDRPYDITAIEQEMEQYVVSKGGIYDWDMDLDNFGWWVDPLPTSIKWYGEKLEKTIKDDVDARMNRNRYEAFRVFFYPLSNGEYEVYVLCG